MARAQAVNTSRLAPALIVLRKVDVRPLSVKVRPDLPTVYEMIGKGQLEAGVSENETVWYADGYIVNDQPRSSGITDEIMGATEHFAIARTDNGDIVRDNIASLATAESLVAGATLSLNVAVDMDEDDEPPADFDPDNMGAGAASTEA